MVTGFTLLFSQSTEAELAEKPRPPLVRAADRKAPEPPRAFAPPQPTAAAAPAVNNMPAAPLHLSNLERTNQQLASQSVRNKKAAKPIAAPLEPHTATLGYGPSEWPPRKFVFPLDPGW